MLFQIQEMLRTERITREAAIQHEIETYNELIPAPGELSATLFVEIADRDTRERRLVELAGLEESFALEVGGKIYPARNETRGVLPDRTTAVHYVKFPLDAGGVAAVVAAGRSGRRRTRAAAARAAPTPRGHDAATARSRARRRRGPDRRVRRRDDRRVTARSTTRPSRTLRVTALFARAIAVPPYARVKRRCCPTRAD